jgi:RNA-binding protein
MSLTSAQRKDLKAKAHHLNPVILMGNQGLTEAVLKAIDEALTAHELIKIKVAGAEREQRQEWLAAICAQLMAEAVDSIGRILIVYRKNPE